MVTAIGSSLFYTLKSLVERPGEIFSLLASTLPYSTHFYLSYFPFQWCCWYLHGIIVLKFFHTFFLFFLSFAWHVQPLLTCCGSELCDIQDGLHSRGHAVSRGGEIFCPQSFKGC